MSKLTHNWHGQSGHSYKYCVKQIDWKPASEQDGNYIFAKQVNGVWNAVYVGQGDLLNRYNAAMKEGCVIRKGATHYHVHLNGNERPRKEEEMDIIKGNPECNWPIGCNGND